jgi:hypothetical protein
MAKRANGANEDGEEPQEGNTEVTVASRVLPEGAIPARHGGWFRPFQPGQSGNPSGYGGAYAARICAQASAAARRQVELMASEDERGGADGDRGGSTVALASHAITALRSVDVESIPGAPARLRHIGAATATAQR